LNCQIIDAAKPVKDLNEDLIAIDGDSWKDAVLGPEGLMWTEYILSAFLLGIVVAIPPGSVTIIAAQRSLQFGFYNSLIFSLGSALADVFYIVIVYKGVAEFFIAHLLLKIVLWFICSGILLFLGISSLSSLKKEGRNNSVYKGITSGTAPTFISGIMVTLTNPMTIIGWLAIAGNFFLTWSSKFPESRRMGFLIILPIMIGVMLWFLPLLYVISRLRSHLNRKTTGIMVAVGSLFLLGFGLFSLYNAFYEIMFWKMGRLPI
jgi:threonine/homoserine/homoserine lactone efflux protein